jgi:hypothetical protein
LRGSTIPGSAVPADFSHAFVDIVHVLV